MTVDLKTVALTILENFGNDPRILQATLIAMAVIACLHLDDLPHCIGLNFIGPPASSKTTVLDLFESSPRSTGQTASRRGLSSAIMQESQRTSWAV